MKRRLFLTGPMGWGKSTAIARAVGEKMPRLGGFLTRRCQNERGQAVSFCLELPDGSGRRTFLDVSAEKPRISMEVFAELGVAALQGDVLVLDEIGGIELLCPEFAAALEAVLRSNTPILGVMKGEGPAGALIEALELTEEYAAAAERLRNWLRNDEDTLLYECTQFDETAARLAADWVKEYCP